MSETVSRKRASDVALVRIIKKKKADHKTSKIKVINIYIFFLIHKILVSQHGEHENWFYTTKHMSWFYSTRHVNVSQHGAYEETQEKLKQFITTRDT